MAAPRRHRGRRWRLAAERRARRGRCHSRQGHDGVAGGGGGNGRQQLVAAGDGGGHAGQHQGLGPAASGEEAFGMTQHVMRAFGLGAVMAGQREQQAEADPERPPLTGIGAPAPRGRQRPGEVGGGQAEQRRVAKSECDDQPGIDPAEQAEVILGAVGKEDVVGVGG